MIGIPLVLEMTDSYGIRGSSPRSYELYRKLKSLGSIAHDTGIVVFAELDTWMGHLIEPANFESLAC